MGHTLTCKQGDTIGCNPVTNMQIGNTALHIFTRSSDVHTLLYFCRQGDLISIFCDMFKRNNGFTPLRNRGTGHDPKGSSFLQYHCRVVTCINDGFTCHYRSCICTDHCKAIHGRIVKPGKIKGSQHLFRQDTSQSHFNRNDLSGDRGDVCVNNI